MTTTLEQLYLHPQNGMDNVYIAAFVSADRTYPIFVTRVIKMDSGNLCVECMGFKWGYEPSVPTMNFAWYDDEQLQRETSERLYTIEQINTYRWQPMNQTLKMPYSIESNLLLQPLKIFLCEIEDTNGDGYAVVIALNAYHARSLITSAGAVHITEIDPTMPNIHHLKY
jgi:hypothetical protein